MKVRWLRGILLAGIGFLPLACGPRSEPAIGGIRLSQTNDKEPAGPPLFREVAEEAGIRWTYTNGEEANHFAIIESLGGGIGLLDYDGDGLLDVFIPGGGSFAGPDKKQLVGHPCKLYHNLGGWKFRDVTAEVGLAGPWFYTHGCAVSDYDRDGWPDLLVTGWRRLALFHNEPIDPQNASRGRHFVDVTEKAGLTSGSWSNSAGWADLDGDGYPDLYICHYVDWSFANHPTDCTYDGKTRDVCAPRKFSGLTHKLFRNNGNATFTDVSTEAGLHKGARDASKGLGVVLVDLNGDGKPDIYVANDTTGNYLYINHCQAGRFHFEEVGLFSGVARDGRGSATGSMGVEAADYDGTGKPSLWVTNYENELHSLYKNECRPEHVFFTYQTQRSGIAALGQKYVGWGTGFLDLDHHGWEDLFIVNGHAIRYPNTPGVTRRQRPLLLRNQHGRFKDISRRGGPYFERDHLGRGLALGDLDNDGRIDAIVSNINEPVAVLRNEADTGDNHWLGIELAGKDHADVVGAKIVLEDGERPQTRFAKSGGSYASSPDRRHVFGLPATARLGRVSVLWPNREEEHWEGLPVDRYYRLVQGEREAKVIACPSPK
ncbi:MAG TPA: CRTAC1 family protein [Gemmataceae bacterium]|jgi:hypothetical protein